LAEGNNKLYRGKQKAIHRGTTNSTEENNILDGRNNREHHRKQENTTGNKMNNSVYITEQWRTSLVTRTY
jgi:hypothetical protein